MKLTEFVDISKIIKNVFFAVMFALIISVCISLYFQPSFLQIDTNKFNNFIEFSKSKYNINNIGEIISPEQVEDISAKINKTCHSEDCPYKKEICETEMCYIYEINFIMQDFTAVSDEEKYICKDYWQSPEITLAFGLEGDCEDSAIFQDSILNNLMNETYIIHSKGHIYNFVCVNRTPVVIDFKYIFEEEYAIKYINEYEPIKYYNYRSYKWNTDITKISCINTTTQIN